MSGSSMAYIFVADTYREARNEVHLYSNSYTSSANSSHATPSPEKNTEKLKGTKRAQVDDFSMDRIDKKRRTATISENHYYNML